MRKKIKYTCFIYLLIYQFTSFELLQILTAVDLSKLVKYCEKWGRKRWLTCWQLHEISNLWSCFASKQWRAGKKCSKLGGTFQVESKSTEIPHTAHITANPPSSEVLGNGCPAAEQVGPKWLQLLTETQHGAERLTVLIQTRVELLNIQQWFLIHKLQELLGLFRHLRRTSQR